MKFTRTSVAAFAVAALLSGGCYDDPLADGRGEASMIQTNRSESYLTVGKSFTVTAKVLDDQMTPIPVMLSATAGSGLRVDSITYVEELRETRIVVTPTGVVDDTPTTLTITGEGLTKTIDVFAYPRTVQGNVPAELLSGETSTPTVTGFDESGGSVGDVAFSVESDDESIIEIGEGNTLIAKGVGTATLTFTGPGGEITDEVDVTVVPGTFTGTATATTYKGAQALRIVPGAVEFDDDTEVEFVGAEGQVYVVSRSAAEIIAVVPYGTSAGSVEFIVAKLGAAQLALKGSGTIPAAATDPHEPNDAPGTGATLTNAGTLFGMMDGSDVDDFYVWTVTEAGDYDVSLEWPDDADMDLYITDDKFTFNFCSDLLTGCDQATAGNPEHAVATDVAPGTYFIYVNNWVPSGVTNYRIVIKKVD